MVPSEPSFAAAQLTTARRPLIDAFDELATSGLKQYGGYIYDEPLRALQGKKALSAYREMADDDPIIGAMLFLIKQQLRKITFKVEPRDEDEQNPAQQPVIDFIETVLDDMETPMEDIIAEMATFLEYGYAPMEFTCKLRQGANRDKARSSRFSDGQIGLRKVALRAQESVQNWEINDKGDILGLHQLPPTGGKVVFIPIEKMILLRTTKIKNNPEGRSILRNAYRPWTLKKAIEKIETMGIERDLAGLPVVRVPEQLIKLARQGDSGAIAALESYKKLATNVRRDEKEGIVLPSDMRPAADGGGFRYDLTLLTSGSRRSFDTNGVITRYSQEMAMSVLVDFVLLGHGARGTQALATTKVDMFLDSIQSYADMMAEGLTQVVETVCDLNQIDRELWPKIKADNTNQVDPERLAAMLSQLTGAGMQLFPDPSVEGWVRERTGIPPASPEALAMRQLAQEAQLAGEMGIDPATGQPYSEQEQDTRMGVEEMRLAGRQQQQPPSPERPGRQEAPEPQREGNLLPEGLQPRRPTSRFGRYFGR